MSGTSADGVDAAILRTDGRGLVEPGPSLFVPYTDDLRARILGLMRPLSARDERNPDEKKIAHDLTQVHIQAVNALIKKSNVSRETFSLIGFHGQTIRHAPEQGITVQIGEPARMAAALGIPVVADFRSNDVRHGGQGAPLVPLYHAALANTLAKPVMVVNIGGVSNVTWIGEESSVVSRQSSAGNPHDLRLTTHDLLAFDCGPGNALMDDWVHQHTGARYDAGGALAAAGVVDEAAVAAFLADAFFACPAPKSLDRNHFKEVLAAIIPSNAVIPPNAVTPSTRSEAERGEANDGAQLGEPQRKLNPVIQQGDTLWNGENGAATLTAMTAAAIAKACDMVPVRPARLLITGGGRHNPTLMRMIAARTGLSVAPVESVGWNGDMLEAEAFAYLAARSVLGLPLSLPSTTGVREPVRGGTLFVP